MAIVVAYSHGAASHSPQPLQQQADPSSRPSDSNNFFLGSRRSCAARILLVLLLHQCSLGSFVSAAFCFRSCDGPLGCPEQIFRYWRQWL